MKPIIIFIMSLMMAYFTPLNVQQKLKDFEDSLPSKEDLICITDAIYFEARGESNKGKIAVGYVVINRSKKRKMTICQTVHQPGQFSKAIKSKPVLNKKKWKEINNLAYKIITNQIKDPTKGSTYFHTTEVNPYWANEESLTAVIGNHVFYKTD